ncbi:MAG: hypothetical protein A2X22_07050 [Bacteroidetes bacterium GWF2_49_14]|nr:MAG: hypothetical protein A2X22_07050 [Bacteroidetes bacterium GWF2_49_14]
MHSLIRVIAACTLVLTASSFRNERNPFPDTLALLEPPDGQVYHGACTMTYASTADPLAGYLGALNDPAIQPAVRGLFFSVPGERGPDNGFRGLKTFFHTADSVGFIPEISLFFMDTRGSTDSIIAVTDTYDWILDSIISLTKAYGGKSFLRIGGEFNGAGPGWNGGGYHPYYYVTMFRKIVDKYDAAGLRDSIAFNWCYEPDAANDFDSVDQRGPRWYPGDDYVDWFGLDVFNSEHFDQALPDSDRRGITKKGKSERFLAMARAKKKPVFMSETSAKGINISSDPQDGINDWNTWFAKFWEFIAVHPEIKGFSYINANWPIGAYPGWGDARIENSPYVTAKYQEEMRKPRYINLITGSGSGITNPEHLSGLCLLPGYPNPFRSATTLKWQSDRAGHTRIDLYNSLGLKVKTLVSEYKNPGNYELSFNQENLPAGTYFFRLSVGAEQKTGRLVITR